MAGFVQILRNRLILMNKWFAGCDNVKLFELHKKGWYGGDGTRTHVGNDFEMMCFVHLTLTASARSGRSVRWLDLGWCSNYGRFWYRLFFRNSANWMRENLDQISLLSNSGRISEMTTIRCSLEWFVVVKKYVYNVCAPFGGICDIRVTAMTTNTKQEDRGCIVYVSGFFLKNA